MKASWFVIAVPQAVWGLVGPSKGLAVRGGGLLTKEQGLATSGVVMTLFGLTMELMPGLLLDDDTRDLRSLARYVGVGPLTLGVSAFLASPARDVE